MIEPHLGITRACHLWKGLYLGVKLLMHHIFQTIWPRVTTIANMKHSQLLLYIMFLKV